MAEEAIAALTNRIQQLELRAQQAEGAAAAAQAAAQAAPQTAGGPGPTSANGPLTSQVVDTRVLVRIGILLFLKFE